MSSKSGKYYNKPTIFVLILGIAFMLVSIGIGDNQIENYKITLPNSQRLTIEVADNEGERAQGLSGRLKLQEDKGMLFVFGMESRHGFWMKDMNFPIDIIWLNSDKQVVHIESDVSPKTYPNVFYPSDKALYVLEVNSGYAARSGIEEGSYLSW